MNKLALVAIVSLVIVAQWALADCGGIPFKAKVAVFEPDQRAVIGFNGQQGLGRSHQGRPLDAADLGNHRAAFRFPE